MFHIRRKRAGELDLITVESKNGGGEFDDFYKLTTAGTVIARKARQQGLSRLFWRLQEIRNQYDESRPNLPEWIVEGESEFFDRLENIRRYEGRDEFPFDRESYR